jgi:hypothetical protein
MLFMPKEVDEPLKAFYIFIAVMFTLDIGGNIITRGTHYAFTSTMMMVRKHQKTHRNWHVQPGSYKHLGNGLTSGTDKNNITLSGRLGECSASNGWSSKNAVPQMH